jgi:hypothetical protein
MRLAEEECCRERIVAALKRPQGRAEEYSRCGDKPVRHGEDADNAVGVFAGAAVGLGAVRGTSIAKTSM